MSHDILDLMRMGIDARFPVQLREYKIFLRPLSVVELVKVSAEVAEALERQPKNNRNAIIEHTLYAQITLQAASTSHMDKFDPQLPCALLQQLTIDELNHMFKQYVAGVDKIDPMLEKMSEERINELVAMAKKNPLILTEFSLLELVNACRHLIENQPTVS